MAYIGIDLGTTYSCVAIVENGRCRIIFDGEGKNFIPSIVSYGNGEVLVGNPALNSSNDLSRVLYDSKRLIGWRFMYNFPIAKNRQLWTFDLDTRNDKVGYVIKYDNGALNEVFITPEEVSAEILKKVKQIAEIYTSDKVTGAVVAIPAFFQTDQIEATKRAIQMAGLELKMLIDEPIAAAIAYNENKKLENSNIMIFDFGGGTLDINICEIKNGIITIKVVKGDQYLGGQDFDGIIMNYVLQEYKKISTYDILGNKRLVKRLRTECRLTKEALSFTATAVDIHLEIGLDDLDLDVQLTRIKFNELCEELYSKTTRLIDEALNTKRLQASDIDYVIMVGGSTRIPAIRDILEKKFGQEKLKFNINPDEAVVFGAAILADVIERKRQIPLINNTMTELPWDINNSNEILFYFYYRNNGEEEGRICLFNSSTCSVEKIAKFHNCYESYQVATTQNKSFGIDEGKKSFEIFDLTTRQLSKSPDHPEWRNSTFVAYFKDKLYYLGGDMNRVDILIDGKWQTGPAFPLSIEDAQTATCDGILYVIDGRGSRKIYQLSDDEREWIEIGEIPKQRINFGVALLNGRIYIAGGFGSPISPNVLKSCLCFDPSAPVGSRISQIADMNYARMGHSLIVTNGKLYAIGGLQNLEKKSDDFYLAINFCDAIEEYDPQTNKWREVGKLNI